MLNTMKKALIILLVLPLMLSSCLGDQTQQKEETINNENSVIEKQAKNLLVLEIDLELSEPEDIRLMAVNTFLNNGKYIDIYITQKMNANETSKIIKFELPEHISPDNFVGISFGPKKVKEVKINSISISYGELNYKANPENILNFFKTNDYLVFDDSDNTFKTKRVDGKHNPILILRKKYIDKIQGIR